MSKDSQPSDKISPEVITQFLKTEHQKALNESQEIRLREKEIELHAKYSEKSLNLQAEFLSKEPYQNRLNLALYAVIGLFGLVAISITGKYLLESGHKDIIYACGDILSYVVTSAVSYYFGTKKNKKKEDHSSAEVIE